MPLPVPPFIRMPEPLVGVTSPLAPETRVTVTARVSELLSNWRVLEPEVMALTVVMSVRFKSFRVVHVPPDPPPPPPPDAGPPEAPVFASKAGTMLMSQSKSRWSG